MLLHAHSGKTLRCSSWCKQTTPALHRSVSARFSPFGTHEPVAEVTQTEAILRTAQRDLQEYCSTLAAEKEACNGVTNWFEQKCQEAEAGHSAEAEEMQRNLRDLALCGPPPIIFNTLLHMKRLEEKQPEAHTHHQHSIAMPGTPVPGTPARNPETRALLVQLFSRADADKNGRLSWSEFNEALHFIGDDLCEEELELVSSALDLQGSVTLDQFLAIVEQAEAQRASPDSDAVFLRHLTHRSPA